MGSLIFLALLLGVMYFILIRPQQRQVKEQQARIRSLEAGMIVVTNSGIHGAIAEVEDKVIWLEVAPEIELKISKGAVAEIITDSQLSPYTASSWGWRIRREDREALLVVAETVARYPLDPFRGRPGAKPGTGTYVRFLMRHLSRRVDRDEVTEAIRRDLLAWALG